MTWILLAIISLESALLIGKYFRRMDYDGYIKVTEKPDGLTFLLELSGDPEELPDRDSVRFKVIVGKPLRSVAEETPAKMRDPT